MVACGPPGLPPGKNLLYHNNGDGTFRDVSEKAGMWNTAGNYALSVAIADLDNDGWPDIYVANDSTAATLYQNQKNGTFKDVAIEAGAAFRQMWILAGRRWVLALAADRVADGSLEVVKTKSPGWRPTRSSRTSAGGSCEALRILMSPDWA